MNFFVESQKYDRAHPNAVNRFLKKKRYPHFTPNSDNRCQSMLAPRAGHKVLAKAKAPPLSWKVTAKLVTNKIHII